MTNDEFRHSFKFPFHSTLGLSVYSCGVQRCAPGHCWGPAVRDHYLIHCVVSGKGGFTCGKEHALAAGDGFLLAPDHVASYKADAKAPWEYCWVGFHGSDAKRLVDQTGLQAGSVFHWGENAAVRQTLMDICNASGPSPADEARMEGRLLLFLAALMDCLGAPSRHQANGYAYVQKAIRFIDFNYSGNIDIEDVAASAGISRSHLYRLFMENISLAPNEYLMRVRINRAAALLKSHSMLSIAEVAYSTGFSDQLYFSRVFKKYMGMPPSKYAASKEERHE